MTSISAVWTISGLSGISSVTGSNGLLAANYYARISTTDTSGVASPSTITISGFSTTDDGGNIQCINLADSSVQGMASISIGESLAFREVIYNGNSLVLS